MYAVAIGILQLLSYNSSYKWLYLSPILSELPASSLVIALNSVDTRIMNINRILNFCARASRAQDYNQPPHLFPPSAAYAVVLPM